MGNKTSKSLGADDATRTGAVQAVGGEPAPAEGGHGDSHLGESDDAHSPGDGYETLNYRTLKLKRSATIRRTTEQNPWKLMPSETEKRLQTLRRQRVLEENAKLGLGPDGLAPDGGYEDVVAAADADAGEEGGGEGGGDGRSHASASYAALSVMDADSFGQAWNALQLNEERDEALARLENYLGQLPDGTFVLYNRRVGAISGTFCSLCLVYQKNLFHALIGYKSGSGLHVVQQAGEKKASAYFKTLSELVRGCSKKKVAGLPCKLRPEGFETIADVLFEDADAGAVGGEGAAATRGEEGLLLNPQYEVGPRAAADGGDYSTIREAGEGPAYENPYASADGADGEGKGEAKEKEGEGYISVSLQKIEEGDDIFGVAFQPCQADQWFFIGLSAAYGNENGRKDQHYDDIDFAIFCQGSGKATARELVDEVGPYLDYSPSSTFEIRLSKKRDRVLFVHNGEVFHSSVRPPPFPLYVSQASHPINGGETLIKGIQWLGK